MSEPLTFRDGVLAGHDSVKGFRVVATDGRAGKVSWATYAPGESYLVVTLGLLSRKHHVVPAGLVTGVDDGEVRVAATRAEIRQLPDVPEPGGYVDMQRYDQLVAELGWVAARTTPTSGW